ncbi:hypothetical protein EHS39_28845 [Ensifer sp. MPMI2T]|nr:hypothetical protein EHS39_28845 [Ensifer sp. MPMI2T]
MDAIAAAATFRDSIEAFGDAARDELTCDGSYRLARANIARLYRTRKTEIETMLEAYSRRPWPTEHHLGVREVAENALAVLDVLYRDFRQALATLHRKG